MLLLENWSLYIKIDATSVILVTLTPILLFRNYFDSFEAYDSQSALNDVLKPNDQRLFLKIGAFESDLGDPAQKFEEFCEE